MNTRNFIAVDSIRTAGGGQINPARSAPVA